MTMPGARQTQLDRLAQEEAAREMTLQEREAAYGHRVASRKEILARWVQEEAAREAQWARVMAGQATAEELGGMRARLEAEDRRRASEVEVWRLENEEVGARFRKEDNAYRNLLRARQGAGHGH